MAKHYGKATVTMAEDATGETFAGAASQGYYWATLRRKALVINDPDSGITLRGRWNDDATTPTVGAATSVDFVLQPGDYAESPNGIGVISVGLYSSGAATYGQAFSVRGND